MGDVLERLQQEIAERAQTERRLRMTEERYRLIAEKAHQGMWLIDAQGRTLFANHRMADMLGCSREELAKKSFVDFCFDEDILQATQRIAQSLRGVSEQFDFRFKRADGSPMVVLGETSPIQDDGDLPGGALGLFADITSANRPKTGYGSLGNVFSTRSNRRIWWPGIGARIPTS